MIDVLLHDLGLKDYKEAWEIQEKLFKATVDCKVKNRERDSQNQIPCLHHLLLCEHPPVVTLGRNADPSNLLINRQHPDIQVFDINRGGDVTFHGPGQLVVYPIFDLDFFFTDIGKYLRLLEESVIQTLSTFGLQGKRLKGATGVWFDPESPSKARKVCAIGIRCSRWVTMHGLGFNISTDLSYFQNIVPCGITDKQVTSLSKELEKEISVNDIKPIFLKAFSELFQINLKKSEERYSI